MGRRLQTQEWLLGLGVLTVEMRSEEREAQSWIFRGVDGCEDCVGGGLGGNVLFNLATIAGDGLDSEGMEVDFQEVEMRSEEREAQPWIFRGVDGCEDCVGLVFALREEEKG
nr:hypothetical protein CFP56_09787 [Quercus suber]